MNTPHRLILMLAIPIPMHVGCGEFAYKTGAGAGALAADKAACQQAPGEYATCMHDKGWTISNLSGDDAPAAPVVAAPAVSGTAAAQAPSAAPAMPASPARDDPMAPVKMTAWVRVGGGGPQDDIDACVAALGPAYAPDTLRHTVTQALLACMKQKGWRAL
jgi:hypothetical protein